VNCWPVTLTIICLAGFRSMSTSTTYEYADSPNISIAGITVQITSSAVLP
jgi:hypothetical protein